jgi:hypothetical protein
MKQQISRGIYCHLRKIFWSESLVGEEMFDEKAEIKNLAHYQTSKICTVRLVQRS